MYQPYYDQDADTRKRSYKAEGFTMIDVVLDSYHFRNICESDKEPFLALRRDASDISMVYEARADFADFSWKEDLADKNTIYMMVFKAPEENFVAACSFQGIHNEFIQLGYDVVAPLRGKGIGTEVVKRLVALAHETFPDKHIQIWIRKDNMASRRVAEKCGARLFGITDSPEAKSFQGLMDKYKDKTDFDFSAYEEIIARGRNSVLIYEV